MSTSVNEVTSGLRPGGRAGTATARLPAGLLDALIARITLAGTTHTTAPNFAPFTGELVREVPVGTADDVREAVRRGREAQKEWAQRSFKERGSVFIRFHDLILNRQAEILDIIQLESGKARSHAFEEVADTAIVASYYAYHSEEHLAPRRRRGAIPGLTTAWEYHHPYGVIGLIAPWNYPLSMAITDAIPALMAGNAVVLKPDSLSPFTALWAARLLDEAGLPPALFQVVTGRGRDIGTPLVESVDYVGFTGSTDTGRTIARQAGARLIDCSLELGGKNPMIVLDDADLDKAVDGAVRGCFSSAGQLCISIERLFVHSSIYDRFLAKFAERTRALRLAPAFDFEADMGCLISREHLEKVESHVRDAVQKGATLVAGGKARPDVGPLFYEPTILADVTDGMRVYAEETFGPVVSVYRFDSVEQVTERANASRFGLNASIWTRDPEFGRKIATRLQTGTVNVNEAYAAAWASVDAPMGGFRDSGLGRRHGRAGIVKYTEEQTVAVQRWLPIATIPPFNDRQFSQVFSAALKLMRRIPPLR